MQKTSKHNEVLNYLKKNGSITSMEAIEMFGATRLSAIISISERLMKLILLIWNALTDMAVLVTLVNMYIEERRRIKLWNI